MTLQGLRGIKPELGRFDFDADCIHVDRGGDWRRTALRPFGPAQRMFTVRVFPYVERADGGIKRGKSVRRIRGYFDGREPEPREAFEVAERICEELEQ